MRMVLLTATALAAIGALACSNMGSDTESNGIQTETANTALRASIAVDPNSDVAGMRYTVTPCDGGPESAIVVDRPLEDQLIPGNIAQLQNNPLDADSEHLFADLFQVVPAGCYDVLVQPTQETGEDSKICSAAWQKGIIVTAGQTTEVFLLVQCLGEDNGAIDIIAAINHEPSLDNVRFDDSKFVCGATGLICLTGSDVDNDPLEFELIAPETCEVAEAPPAQEGEHCFNVTCHDWGRMDLRARVYDLIHKDGELVRIEDWLAEAGYPNESHGELNFYAYFDGIKYYPDMDEDGYGDPNAPATLVCEGDEPPDGYVTDNTDCDPDDPQTYPGAEEVCDEKDNDCNGEVDDGIECGECDHGGRCGTYQFGECDCGPAGFCVTTAEGEFLCHKNTACAPLASCNATTDCDMAAGEVCIVETCCPSYGVCIKAVDLEPQCQDKELLKQIGPSTGAN